MNPIIEARNLVKSFPSGDTTLVVLKKLNFSVNEGEFVSVTGRSGSGKSTLLYLMGLLDDATEGEIFISGQNVSNLSQDEKTNMRLNSLGYIFQDYALVPELTALENVLTPLLMQGLPKSAATEKAKRSLDRFGLSDKYDNLPSQLSGGQQQRVSIARAVAHNPKILFADEPTANLDLETSEIVLSTFEQLHSEGQTIIMVTHEPEYAQRTERIVTLSDGIIASDERVNKLK